MSVVAALACAVAAGLAGLRWLRVAQREHYEPGACSQFALRWWFGLGFNRLLAAVVLVDLVLSVASPFFALLVAVPVAVGPFGLRLRGTAPGPLAWTRRARTLAAVWGAISLLVVVAGALAGVGAFAAALVAALAPVVVDTALAVTRPIEASLARRFVEEATRKLRSINPTVIAITGSYGKTGTKGYTAHLIEGSRTVVPTPASFNNAAGLARAINESLPPGTEVFVAEMGTYGPGEIASMCSWVRPRIAAITAIGPVHLERMKTEENITRAKAEIFETADTAVLNVDNAHLAGLVDELAGRGKKVVRCSAADPGADVFVGFEGDHLVVRVAGEEAARYDDAADVLPTNAAIAVALALEVGVPLAAIVERLPSLPVARNRREVVTGSTGATFIDDTYNSNPAGARAALGMLRRYAPAANRSVVVTPGMIELGPRQAEENERFAAAASEIATDVVVIGTTNRRSLTAGAHQGRARVHLVDDRAAATAWVRDNTSAGDVVLFENDLPDHFP